MPDVRNQRAGRSIAMSRRGITISPWRATPPIQSVLGCRPCRWPRGIRQGRILERLGDRRERRLFQARRVLRPLDPVPARPRRDRAYDGLWRRLSGAVPTRAPMPKAQRTLMPISLSARRRRILLAAMVCTLLAATGCARPPATTAAAIPPGQARVWFYREFIPSE